MRSVKPFIAVISDADGETYEYLFESTSRKRVKRNVREWCEQTDWGATIVAIRPHTGGQRLLRITGITFAVSGITITVAMIIGLTLEGAL